MYAICKLCCEQQEFDRAEIKYSQSPSNLVRHLNTDFPGHRKAYDACMDHKNGKPTAADPASSGPHVQQEDMSEITSYFGKDTTTWHQQLARWIVMNAVPFSVRYACPYFSLLDARG